MESKDEKEKDKDATNWLTRPIYKIMILALVILELFEKGIDGGMKNAIHIVLWIGLGAIVLINVVNLFLFFGKKKTSAEDDHSVQEEE